MRGLFRGAVAALALSLVAGASAAVEFDAAKAFGAREMVRQASLSPDGKTLALIQPLAEGQAYGLFVVEVDGDAPLKPVLSSSGNPDRLMSCGWVSNKRLVCNVYFVIEQAGRRIAYTRLVGINADGSNMQLVSARPSTESYSLGQDGGNVVDWLADDPDGAVLVTRSFSEEYSTGTLLNNNKGEGLGIERVDTGSLKRTLLENPKPEADFYISDQHGAVRLYAQRPRTADGYDKGKLQFYYRSAARGAWQQLGVYDEDQHTGFRPTAVDRDLNAAYGYEWINGHRAIVRIALDGSMKREVIYTRDDVDVDELIRIGKQRRVVGVGYATDKRYAVFFDAPLKSLAASLSKALPGQPLIRFVDASLDESRLLLWAGSDVEPGRYYLYDKTKRQLRPLIEERPHLTSVKLASVKPITYKAADGTVIPAYLTLPASGAVKNLPAIVLPHGGPGARDEWGFDWLAQFFAARGYAVLQPNFRGSAGYGETWFQENGFKSWRTAVGDVNDAGRWLKEQQIAAPDKLAIVGWSYGGYAALQSQVLDAELFKAVVAIAPVTDLDALREESRRFVSFKLVDDFIGHGPHIRDGSPAQNAESFKAPVLMFHGGTDENVDVGESKLMLARLKGAGRKADLVVFPELDHQLDDSKAREQMLSRIDAFLRTSLGL